MSQCLYLRVQIYDTACLCRIVPLVSQLLQRAVYLAYGLFRDRADPNTTMTPAVRILFMVFFALAGVGLVVYALIVWKRAMEEEKNEKQDDPNQMK